jgi:pyruvate formate lyase activating enzyme
MKGLIFSIKRYAIHDGPGIRVTFFMKGCPLNCWWCHNPEGISPEVCSVERTDRVGEREFKSMEVVGKEYTPEELLAIAEKERVFMEQSGGGVTFSGGEPTLQFAFLLETLQLMKRLGINTAVDTSGQVSSERLKQLIPYTDTFLFDLKHLDPEEHKKYTGVDNSLILKNLDMLIDEGAHIMIRVPVIPGVSDNAGYMNRLSEFIVARKGTGIKEINLLPYHKTGTSKYRRFKMENRMEGRDQVPVSVMKEFKEIISSTGIKVKIGG